MEGRKVRDDAHSCGGLREGDSRGGVRSGERGSRRKRGGESETNGKARGEGTERAAEETRRKERERQPSGSRLKSGRGAKGETGKGHGHVGKTSESTRQHEDVEELRRVGRFG
ncbi:hypothetical protein GY45DRAFT_1018163 [Cubamyces sp. BRFM 1775]|nr:hypothetical protein GY45DRAFT_1018163 [Cubamyces sp. BRFM 1775]